ncbi:MAG TPA: hypothetical protein VMJ30_00400, partial [Gemmatimonadales bacterium]|nr:hypothetical protein [Gemmatimonadales bacterium]
MITSPSGTLTLLLLAILPAGTLLAQDDEHEGRPTSETLRPISENAHRYPQGWAAFGFGAGEESYRYSGVAQVYSPTVMAPMITGSIGARLSPFLDLGLEAYGWFNGEQQGNLALGGFQLITRLHPLGRWMYLKGGGGIATSNYWDAYDCGCGGGPTYVGFAYSVGGGLEIP